MGRALLTVLLVFGSVAVAYIVHLSRRAASAVNDASKMLRETGSITQTAKQLYKEQMQSPTTAQNTVEAQLPEVEAVLGRWIVDFHDRTNLHYVLIFPIMHKMAVKLFVEDFGIQAALKHYERLVAMLTSDGTIRESQFESFGWPDLPPEDVPHTKELDAQLWKLARDLIGRGILKETIASALVSIAMREGLKGNPLVSAGFLITTLKELRAGIYTPPPEVRPKVPEGADKATTTIFNSMFDLACKATERSGLEWQHLLPGMQRVCAIYTIKFAGKAGALEFFLDQVQKVQSIVDECPKNPPQRLPITPLDITNMAKFNEAFLRLADNIAEVPGTHPAMIAGAASMLVAELAYTHYDPTFLSAVYASSCTDIERGEYDFVKKTH
jgi:hypothetical protein